jgi:hypothetical protein
MPPRRCSISPRKPSSHLFFPWNINLARLCVNLCLAVLLLGVLRAQAQFTNYWRLHSFGTTNLAGANPEGTLIQCRDGFICGVTSHGGSAEGADLGVTGIPGYTYVLQRSTDLAVWLELGRFLTPNDVPVPYADPNAPPAAAFYRVLAR